MKKSENDGGQAFPLQDMVWLDSYGEQHGTKGHYGLSVREWYAGQALAGMIASEATGENYVAATAAKRAFELADAMIAEGGEE